MPCAVCGGRVVKTEKGQRCLKPTCAGAQETATAKEGLDNCCGAPMAYTGLNQLGEPLYKCAKCNRTKSM